MNVVLYTIGCPQCVVLEKKLKDKGVDFIKVTDMEQIKDRFPGQTNMPMLDVDGVEMSFRTAIEWVNNM